MINSKHRFTLEVQSAHSQIALPVKVGDTGTKFYISLTDGGNPFIIPGGTLAMLTIHRPTGTFLQAFCPIRNNTTVIYDFMQNENTAAVEGVHNCELTLYGGTSGSIISTSWFTMIVSARVVNDDSLNITDENRNAFDAMIAAEASRQAGEESRVNAEAARVLAEEARVRAEAARESATTNAGTVAELALTKANEAFSFATSANTKASQADRNAATALELAAQAINTTQLPIVTADDEGKVLTVVGGRWVAKEVEEYDGELEVV